MSREGEARSRPRFAILLRSRRVATGLTIEGLAALSEVSPRTISDLERGRIQRPQRRTLEALLDALTSSPQDRQFMADVAQADRRSATPVPLEWCQLPSPTDRFTGRTDTLQLLARVVEESTTSLGPAAVVVLTGPAGVGKTALAVRAATDLASRFPGGAHFIDLRGMDEAPLSPAEAPGGLMRALGVGGGWIPRDVDELASYYRTLLRERPALIVLDNVADEAQVRPLLPGDGRSFVLLTSRRQLSGLVGVHRAPVDALPADEAVALLSGILGEAAQAENFSAVAELARYCGNLPLALRVAGFQLGERPDWSIEDMLALLEDENQRLPTIDGAGDGVGAALMLSYQQLSAPAQRTFRRLALIPGANFSAEAAAVLSGDSLDDTERTLEDLVELGLLLAVSDDRYGFHDLVRAFAGGRLNHDEPDDRQTAQDRLVGWLLNAATAAGRHFEPDAAAAGSPTGDRPWFADPEAAAEWLDAELGNWFPALRLAAAGDRHDLVIEVAESMHWFSDRRLSFGVWHEVFELAARSALALGDVRREAVHLNYLAWAQGKCLGDFRASADTAMTALARATAIGDTRQQAWALNYASLAHTGLGDPDAALDCRLRTIALFREADDHEGLPQALAGLGDLQLARGRAAEALESHREALALVRDPHYPMGRSAREVTDALACKRIGVDLTVLGRWPEAVAALRESLAAIRRMRVVSHEAGINLALAEPLRRQGEVEQARDCLLRAIEVADLAAEPDLEQQARSQLSELGGSPLLASPNA
jgi:tetratricopeptide (TPR) repeat protein/transcriptional regulator with XRE-family HTH domain